MHASFPVPTWFASLPAARANDLRRAWSALAACDPAPDPRSLSIAAAAARQLAGWACPPPWITAALLLGLDAGHGALPARVAEAAGPEACAIAERYALVERQPLQMADMWRGQAAPPYDRLQKLFVASYLDEPVAFLGMAALLSRLDYLEQERPADMPQVAANLQTVLLPVLERYGLWNDRKHSADRLTYLADYARACEIDRLIREHDARREDVEAEVRAGLHRLGLSEGVDLRVHTVRASRVLEESQSFEIQRFPGDPEQVIRAMSARLALDVWADTDEACYRVLGALHRLGRYVPGALRDYISASRFNSYRMIHTRIRLGEHGAGPAVDFFIGSEASRHGNEYGRAAEWMHPAEGPAPGWWHGVERERRLLEAQLETQRQGQRAKESLVFTPLGELHTLPLFSTPFDFAFKVHTDLGDFYSGARINGAEARHGDRLATLDIVVVYFDPRLPAQLRPDWMTAITTPAATAGLKKQVRHREATAARGKAMLRQALSDHFGRLGIALTDASLRSHLEDAVRRSRSDDPDSLFLEIARGDRSAEGIALRLIAVEAAHFIRYADGRPLDVGRERVRMAGCCKPTLETPIVGRLSQPGTPFAGIKVHVAACPNAKRSGDVVALAWHEPDYQGLYRYLALGSDREGLLQELLAPFYAGGHYLHKVLAERVDDCTAQFLILAETRDAETGRRLLEQIEAVSDIHEASARPVALSPADQAARRLTFQRANPYAYNEPAYRGGEFVGRAAELKEVAAYLERRRPNGPLIVHGPWRIGKTSLLKHVLEYDSRNFGAVAAYLSCQSIHKLDMGTLSQAIAAAVEERLQREMDRLGVHPLQLSREDRQRLLDEPVPQLRAYLARVDATLRDSRGLRLIVLIDEFSDVYDCVAAGALTPRVFAHLREGMGDSEVAFVVAVQAKVLAHMRETPEHGSGLFEVAALCPLGPLEPASLRKLLIARGQSIGLLWEDEAADEAMRLSGANPYMLNLLAHEAVRLVGDTGEQAVASAQVHLAVETVLEQDRTGDVYLRHLTSLLETDAEEEVFRVLGLDGGQRWWLEDDLLRRLAPPAGREELIHLLEKGLAVRERGVEGRTRVRLSIPLLAGRRRPEPASLTPGAAHATA